MVEGRVTKVVTFGAFVEILPGVEGLVHISELANHHVENPREVVNQGDAVRAKVIEMDADRRRLSLSLKRVADDEVVHAADASALELSDEMFTETAEDEAPAERAGRRGRARGRRRAGGRGGARGRRRAGGRRA